MIINSKPEKMKLTLGALMEIEEGLGISGLSELSEKMTNPAAGDLVVLLSALLRGAGSSFTYEQLRSADININIAIEEISKTFSDAFNTEGDNPMEKRDP